VLALASDGDCGLAIVDGNGDGAELESEQWLWDAGDGWVAGSSSGTGPLDYLGSLQTGGEFGDACFAYGRARERQSVTISFAGREYEVRVGAEGVWAFLKVASGSRADPPAVI
jgi:hypothetical protein